MTIFTAEHLLEKKDKPEDTFDVEIQFSEKKALNSDTEDDPAVVYQDTTYPVISVRRVEQQKKRCCVQLCLFAGMILGLSLCVLGSVFLYRNMYTVRYSGRCGVGLLDLSYNDTVDYVEDPVYATPAGFRRGRTDIEEQIDIDGPIETLITQAQYNASAATFRHDFDRNMTAVRDALSDFCYFVPFINAFGNGMIPSPKEFSSFLENKQPADSPMVYEMHEYFERKDPVEDALSQFGEKLSEICDGTQMYTAEPRSLDDYDYATTQAYTTPAPLTFDLDRIFRMYPGGSDIYTYHIYTFEMEDY